MSGAGADNEVDRARITVERTRSRSGMGAGRSRCGERGLKGKGLRYMYVNLYSALSYEPLKR